MMVTAEPGVNNKDSKENNKSDTTPLIVKEYGSSRTPGFSIRPIKSVLTVPLAQSVGGSALSLFTS
jgi:hypothetical protein